MSLQHTIITCSISLALTEQASFSHVFQKEKDSQESQFKPRSYDCWTEQVHHFLFVLLPMRISSYFILPFRRWHSIQTIWFSHLIHSLLIVTGRDRKCCWTSSGATFWVLRREETHPVCQQVSSGPLNWSSHQIVWHVTLWPMPVSPAGTWVSSDGQTDDSQRAWLCSSYSEILAGNYRDTPAWPRLGGGGGSCGTTARPPLLPAQGLFSVAAQVSRPSPAVETAVDFKCPRRQSQRS